ncbi:diaminopimelate epimerase [Planctomycetales bacterium]|nr:diaminopimelate epimerase [Planctomycetales bacterium]GHS96704.1 diaminopimelate epimerase [Planctomycetales bacterium]GHT08278.1 diaminopimelate epimerase [Planctomycetales bacterium]
MTAGGNDFIVFDNRDGRYDGVLAAPATRTDLIARRCRRGYGVGADGVIFGALATGGAALTMRYFDADGSEAPLCGNGATCLMKLALDERWLGDDSADGEILLQTAAGLVRGKPLGNSRWQTFVPPPEEGSPVEVRLENGDKISGDYWRVGVPHLVVFVAAVATVDVRRRGRELRRHPQFAAVGGVNVNFVEIIAAGEIRLRTFETGVEDETLSCGTGSIASALAAWRRGKWADVFAGGALPVRVHSQGGEDLQIRFTRAGERFENVNLETAAYGVCVGELFA